MNGSKTAAVLVVLIAVAAGGLYGYMPQHCRQAVAEQAVDWYKLQVARLPADLEALKAYIPPSWTQKQAAQPVAVPPQVRGVRPRRHAEARSCPGSWRKGRRAADKGRC